MIAAFFRMESAGGIVLVIASVLAIIVANSPLADLYTQVLHTRVGVHVGEWSLDKSLHHWINDGLMVVFFLLVGLEIKREFLIGELSSREQAILPFIAAAGGMLVPGLIFFGINVDRPEYLNGWAIPTATDIAFAIAALSILGKRVPIALKVLLTAIAIIDDLGAIVIIAIFYTHQLSFLSLGLAGLGLVALFLLNTFNVSRLAPYLLVGAFLWLCVLQSGVHATLAGVAVALAIPLRGGAADESLLIRCEHGLHPWVAFCILPLFGFANAGLSFSGMGWHSLTDELALGVALGLFVGKQLGVFASTWLAVRSGLARLPQDASWLHIYGMAVLCGIGFTMSLFIGTLAWPHSHYDATVRLAIIVGSLASVVWGTIVVAAAGRVSGNASAARG